MEEAEILLRNAMEHHGAAVYRLKWLSFDE